MGLFNFAKNKSQKKTEKKTKLTQKAVKQTQARNRAMRGGPVAGLSGLASRDMAQFPNPKGSAPRTTQLRKFK